MNIIKMPIRIVKSYRKNKSRKVAFQKTYKLVHENLMNLPQPELSVKDIEEIDAYWGTYGIKFQDYSWFQWYYGITGIKSPKFIPHDIYLKMILPYYNRREYVSAWKDKNTFNRFLPNVKFPDTIIKKINGLFYDNEGNYIGEVDSEKLFVILSTVKQVIVKSTYNTGCGKSVKKYNVELLSDAEKILEEWDDDNYIIQKAIKQHEFFAKFNQSSVNIIRINTWYHDGKVEIFTPVLRFGMPGYVTDVCFIDGKEIIRLVGITNDGFIKKELVHFSGEKKELSEVINIDYEKVPCWDEIVDMLKKNAPMLSYFNLVGWDVTVCADDNRPVVIEYNISSPGPYPSQVTNGPMFGDYTDQILNFLKDKKNQEKYIPKWLKAN